MEAPGSVGSSVSEGQPRTVVIGAGPAGLTAAYELVRRGLPVTVLEAEDVVGGISRTVERDGWRFDIGGHRFFTKVQAVEDLWHEILPDDFLVRPRLSRIYYDGKFFDYPIKPLNALRNLGVSEAARCVASYLAAKARPPVDRNTLEGYIVANYGWRLYRHFFQTYNEKVWGVPASQLSADFGAQRIKGMSLFQAVWEPVRARLVGRHRDKVHQVTSLIEEFQYPKLGPGMMWERCAAAVVAGGAAVSLSCEVVGVDRGARGATSVTYRDAGGQNHTVAADHVISSMPLVELIGSLHPPAPDDVVAAAGRLRYRDFVTVALVLPEERGFPDNWIYIHDPGVGVGRIQNFGSWSPYLVKDGSTCLGMEYFVFEGDDLWSASDEALVARAAGELVTIGLARPGDVRNGYVVRVPKAYPVYDEGYQQVMTRLRQWLALELPNVHPVGRNGMHRYNNQDHSMYTAMLTVANIADGTDHDIWSVNVEQEYHETRGDDGSGTAGPTGAPKGRSGAASGSGVAGTGRDAPILPVPAVPGTDR